MRGDEEAGPDDLVSELIADPERLAALEEIAVILEHVARAPFNTRRVEAPPVLVGKEFLGRRLGAREDSLTVHLAQRVLIDEQWSDATTREEFLEDIRRAVSHPEARLAVYEARQTSYAAVAAPNVVPSERLGRASGRYVIVFYSANSGRMISARQARDESRFNVPEGQVAQLTQQTIRRVDHLLTVSESQWEWLAEVDTRFGGWDPDDQEAFVLEWAIEEDRLDYLQEYYERNAMTGEQMARYEELKKLVVKNRPIIERLADR